MAPGVFCKKNVDTSGRGRQFEWPKYSDHKMRVEGLQWNPSFPNDVRNIWLC